MRLQWGNLRTQQIYNVVISRHKSCTMWWSLDTSVQCGDLWIQENVQCGDHSAHKIYNVVISGQELYNVVISGHTRSTMQWSEDTQEVQLGDLRIKVIYSGDLWTQYIHSVKWSGHNRSTVWWSEDTRNLNEVIWGHKWPTVGLSYGRLKLKWRDLKTVEITQAENLYIVVIWGEKRSTVRYLWIQVVYSVIWEQKRYTIGWSGLSEVIWGE